MHYYKPTNSHSYLLYSSSHPLHIKNSILFLQFLSLRRLRSLGYIKKIQKLALSFRNLHNFI